MMPTNHSVRTCRRALLVVVLLLVALLAGCGEDLRSTPSVGVTELRDDMGALSFSVVADRQGQATLVGTLVNHGSRLDQLVAVDAASPSTGTTIVATLPGGPLPLPVGEPVQLGERFAVQLTSPSSFPLGHALELTMTFAHADEMVLKVVMYPQRGYYDDVATRPTQRPPGDGTVR